MLEESFGLNFFLKTPKNNENIRSLYVRVTVDGIPKETSTKQKWDINRWDQKRQCAVGSKEDSKTLNFFIENLTTKINQYKTELMINEKEITANRIVDFILGNRPVNTKVLEEFQLHNDEMEALVPREYAPGTLERYVTARSHVKAFLKHKYGIEDLEFRELNLQFIKDYEYFLKTVRECSNNTALKYISNFKKIVLRAIDKEIIIVDPFKAFKRKKTKLTKKPLTAEELYRLENFIFSTPRLALVRDIFVFQCYTGLAYIDVYQLKKSDIKVGLDGEKWIMSSRQKTTVGTDIPLLPKALEIMDKYWNDPLCVSRYSVLPVKSNQKMNAYLKEIADLCGFNFELTTHKARRTFGSTVTLNNNVPINVVKEMLGHSSVKQTEEYAITEQRTISREMNILKERLGYQKIGSDEPILSVAYIKKMEDEINKLKAIIAEMTNLAV